MCRWIDGVNKQPSLYVLLSALWKHISPHRRWQLMALVFLILLGAVAEVVSLGMMLPFLGLITAPDKVFASSWSQPLITTFGLTSPAQLLLPLTALFGLAAVTAGAIRLVLLWGQTRLGNAIGHDLGSEAFRRTLYQPYTVHCLRSSSEVVAALINKIHSVTNHVVIPLLTLIASAFILLTVMGFMLYVDPQLTCISFLGFGLLYIVVAFIAKKQLARDSQIIASGQNKVTKVLQEGLGGIKDVLINGLQEVYYALYRNADYRLRRASANLIFIGGAPRPVVESIGLAFIGLLAYFLDARPGGITAAIPMLGTLALSAQRLLPLVQQSYAGWVSMVGNKKSLSDVLSLLDQPLPAYVTETSLKPVSFTQEMRLKQVFFRYGEGPWIVNNMNLVIPKGGRVGFIGPTGSGKSTLLDVIMGLLPPASGTLSIDGVTIDEANRHAWQTHIAHVPQAIFLTDTTIAENIAFGVAPDAIDHAKVRDAAHKAQIASTIESWPAGYDTMVGERGVRLSGGQRQRIAIARALYRQADVIVFDEATSALDNDTEQAIIESIDLLSKDLTILLIAHRMTTLRHCDFIVELKDGMLQKVGNYQELVARPPQKNSTR